MKPCTQCGIIRPLIDFHRDCHTRDGRACKCKVCFNEIKRGEYRRSSEKHKRGALEWQKSHPENKRISQRKYIKRRKISDPLFRLQTTLSARTRQAFKAQGLSKSGHTLDFIDCSTADLQTWLASKFADGMTAANHGTVWDIDHIIPCSAWDLTKPEHVRACFHWTNLQPLPKAVNRWQKGGVNRYPSGHFEPIIAERLMILRALEVL